MTTELSAAIRQHIDASAPPLSLDDITTEHAGTRVAVMPERSNRRSRAGLGLVAAAGLVVLGSVAMYAVVTRPDSNEEEAAPTETVGFDPAWYAALAPALPDGFHSIAITSSNEQYVNFESFDLLDGRSLQFMVSRVAMEPDPGGAITLKQALATPAGQPLDELDISLPDGRQIGVACVIDLGPCPETGSGAMSPTDLRSFATHLATNVGPEELPPATGTLNHVALTDIRRAADGAIGLLVVAQLEAPHYAMSFVQYAPEPLKEGDLDQQIVVRTLTGLYPTPPASETISRTDTPAGATQWLISLEGVLWSVSDSTGQGPAVGQRVLTAVTTTMP